MRCPAHRGLSAHAKHKPGGQYWYSLNCCPTCPSAGAFTCVCQHTSELAYIFGTVSDYQSASAPLTCQPENTFDTFADKLIASWVGIAANNSHDGTGVGAAWPSFADAAALFHLDEQAQGGPGTLGIAGCAPAALRLLSIRCVWAAACIHCLWAPLLSSCVAYGPLPVFIGFGRRFCSVAHLQLRSVDTIYLFDFKALFLLCTFSACSSSLWPCRR